jgi:hypothetical protein
MGGASEGPGHLYLLRFEITLITAYASALGTAQQLS